MELGVNWYLTENDDKNDGKIITYLDKNKKRDIHLCSCDEDLAGILGPIARKGKSNKTVKMIKKDKNILHNAAFYDKHIDNDVSRKDWFKESLDKLEGCDIIFADPDNGISEDESDKHITRAEIGQYYKRGQSVIVYYHVDRKKKGERLESFRRFQKDLPCVKAYWLRFHRGTARDYWIFAHPKHEDIIAGKIEGFKKLEWCNKKYGHFTLEA